nr:M1 family metallopeptidase [Nonlabens xiamenensis]
MVGQVEAQLLRDRQQFDRQDSLRGSITPERAWWDLKYYDLDVQVWPEKKYIKGSNTISYTVIKPYNTMQIDLQAPMEMTKVVQNGNELQYRREGNVYFIEMANPQPQGAEMELTIDFQGHPREAKNAPWDGGFSWKKDSQGNHFIATSNQGLGASVWWPCKDHMYQEPEGMRIGVRVPSDLMNVSNGRLVDTQEHKDDTTTYVWEVKNPINNYGVNINIGNYAHFSEVYPGEAGDLDMDYYVLEHHLEKAKKHFTDAGRMMKAFEHWFGPYPFYEDSFKLVEVPYLGMEHQSSVTYGNKFRKGYLGMDLSDTGWGLKFDFIIIHEAGHEWFANSITNQDIADMWIHESFTAYAENLFLDYYYGQEASAAYVIGTRTNIENDRPIIGLYDVNHEGSGDMYYKGANMIHMIRQLVNDDDKWRRILREMNLKFRHQIVTTQEIEGFLSEATGMELDAFFDQYLRDVRIPVLEYHLKGGILQYRWNNVVDGFKMPVELIGVGESHWIYPTTETQSIKLTKSLVEVKVDPDYYVTTSKSTEKL